MTDVANDRRDKEVLVEEESFIDAISTMAKVEGSEIDPGGKRHKNIAIVDHHSFPCRLARTRQIITKFAWCNSASTVT